MLQGRIQLAEFDLLAPITAGKAAQQLQDMLFRGALCEEGRPDRTIASSKALSPKSVYWLTSRATASGRMPRTCCLHKHMRLSCCPEPYVGI